MHIAAMNPVYVSRDDLEVLVHGTGAVQQLLEDFKATGDSDENTGGGPQRVAAAHSNSTASAAHFASYSGLL